MAGCERYEPLELIRRFNDFHDAVVHAKGKDAVARTLGFLNDYTMSHFAREEACMASYHCPAAAANKSAHDDVRANLATIRDRIGKEGIQSIDVVQLELILGNWIRNHICSIDIQLRGCVSQHGAQ